MRSKLAGGARSEGIGVLCPGGQELSFKRHGERRASRPQLKRDRLGGAPYPEGGSMNQRQLASVLFAVVGVFIAASYLPYIAGQVIFLFSSDAVGQQAPGTASPLLSQLTSIAFLTVGVLISSALVLFRNRLAERLFPAGPLLGGQEFQAVGLSVLGCYFVIEGISGVFRLRSRTLEWGAVAQVVLGAALFLGARGISRLWSLARTAGTGHESRGNAA